MPKNPAVDAYIEKAAPFAQPILRHLRALVHAACPEVEEAIKWQFPAFGHRGPLCHMAAFKSHCAFGFWKHARIIELADADADNGETERAMGQFGRITRLADLPANEVLRGYILKAMALNEAGVKTARRRTTPAERAPLVMPADLAAALRENAAANGHFEGFSYSNRKEYIDWLTEAKTEATRSRRLATALEWIAEGKSRNWKYERK